jgi:hypothetical protein
MEVLYIIVTNGQRRGLMCTFDIIPGHDPVSIELKMTVFLWFTLCFPLLNAILTPSVSRNLIS